MNERPAPGSRRPGGRTARVRNAVFQATVLELGRAGYAAVSLDAIAAPLYFRLLVSAEPLTQHAADTSAAAALAAARAGLFNTS
jgi:hypothetical protein